MSCMSSSGVCQVGSTESKIEVRRVDMTTLKLSEEHVFELFTFEGDTIMLLTHQSLSNNLYAFGNWVRQLESFQ